MTALWIRKLRMDDGSVEHAVEIGETKCAWITNIRELREEFEALVPVLALYKDDAALCFTNWIHTWPNAEEAEACLLERYQFAKFEEDDIRFVDINALTITDGRRNVAAALQRLRPLKSREVYDWFGVGCERGCSEIYSQHFAAADRLVRQLAQDLGAPPQEQHLAWWIKTNIKRTRPSGVLQGRCWLCGYHKPLSTMFGMDCDAVGVGALCSERIDAALTRCELLETMQIKIGELAHNLTDGILHNAA